MKILTLNIILWKVEGGTKISKVKQLQGNYEAF